MVAMIVFVVLSALQAAKPLNLDSMDFPAAAEATASSGVPIYYRGEQNPTHSGLYHPPLYIYTLAVWFKLVGASPAAARMFGALCLLLLGWITLATYGTMVGRRTTGSVSGWFWLVFLLNPFSLQTAAIPDIDSSVYGPILVAILWQSLKIVRDDGVPRTSPVRAREYLVLACLFALAFWCKLTTILVVPAFVTLAFAARFRFWGAMARAFAVACSGFIFFLASYKAYGWALGQNTSYTFSFLWYSIKNRGSSMTGGFEAFVLAKLGNLASMIPFTEKWTTALPWLTGALVVILTVLRARALRCDRVEFKTALCHALLPCFGLFVTLYYCAQVKSFGNAPFKYYLPVWGLMMFPLAWILSGRPIRQLVDGKVCPSIKTVPSLAVGVLLVSAVVGSFIVGDSHIFDGRFSGVGWVLAATSLTAIVTIVGTCYRSERSLVIAASLSVLVHSGLQLGICVLQARMPYSTTYNYRQRGLQETAAFIAAITDPGEVISSMKDLGHTAKRRYIENYGYFFSDAAGIDRYARLIRDKRVRYLVVTSGIGEDQLFPGTLMANWVDANAREFRQIGNYRIFEVSQKSY